MAWDCLHCGRKGNRGPAKHCGGCGAPRGEDIQFYLPKDARIVTDVDEVARAKAGPDWTCQHCSGDNLVANDYCDNCGAPRGSSRSRETRERLSREEIETPPTPEEKIPFTPEPEEVSVSRTEKIHPPDREPPLDRVGESDQKVQYIKIGAIALLILALVIGGSYLLFGTRKQSLTITGFHWSRDITIERFATLTQQGWQGEVPGDARILSQNYEIRTYRQVLDHYDTRTRQVAYQVLRRVHQTCYRDLGNGYAESYDCSYTVYDTEYRTETYQEPVYRSEPVYDWRYTYEVDRWITDHIEHSEGDDQEPAWPKFRLSEEQREGAHQERYIVVFIDGKEKEHRHEFGYEEWKRLDVGEACLGKFNNLGMLLSVDCEQQK